MPWIVKDPSCEITKHKKKERREKKTNKHGVIALSWSMQYVAHHIADMVTMLSTPFLRHEKKKKNAQQQNYGGVMYGRRAAIEGMVACHA